MQYAVLSDIHANIWALEAVLQDVNQRGITQIINLGDTLYGPLEPQATAACLMQFPLVSIQGNQDRVLLEQSGSAESPTLEYVRKNLAPSSLEWLALQPSTYIMDELFLCHGSPLSDEEYLLDGMSPQGGYLNELSTVREQLTGIQQQVILCGHSHIPRSVKLADGRLVMNPGSVGLPAYTDDTPVYHKMENGTPHARYAIITESAASRNIDHVSIEYPWEKAAKRAGQLGRNDWAEWLIRGKA